MGIVYDKKKFKKNSLDQNIINLQASNKLEIIYMKQKWIKLLKLKPNDGLKMNLKNYGCKNQLKN